MFLWIIDTQISTLDDRYLPYVNAVRTVKMATTLFLCDEDTVSRDTVTRYDALHSIFIT